MAAAPVASRGSGCAALKDLTPPTQRLRVEEFWVNVRKLGGGLGRAV